MPTPARLAAEAIARAGALLVTAGAGMGVDSGLPDFRGDEGFWRAYPPFRALGLSFVDLAQPRWFSTDPELAWGFYGHRLELYRRTAPHAGFAMLRRFGEGRPTFVYTSNVDGAFGRAGFPDDAIVECHGSLHHLQCTRACGVGLFPADGVSVDVDPDAFRARPPLPSCPGCGALARPNVLMFDDYGWDPSRTAAQEARLRRWLAAAPRPLVVVELGAGLAVPTVRRFSERAALGGTLVRINPRDTAVPPGGIAIADGALAGLRAIAEAFA